MKHYIRTPCALHKLSFFSRADQVVIRHVEGRSIPTVIYVDELATNPTPVATRLSGFESKLVDSLAV